jgi:hypothetical protein
MGEREGTPEEFARLAAELRGQSQAKQAEAEAPEPDPVAVPQQTPDSPESEPDLEAEEFVERLLAPKPGHAELIRRLHPEEE